MKYTRWIAALFMCLLGTVAAAQEGFVSEFPPALRFEQHTQIRETAKNIYIKCVYPDTLSDVIDEEMRELIDEMKEQNEEKLPLSHASVPSYLDVGSIITRSGESTLSFLTIAEISREKEQLSVDYRTRVYDVQTGAQLTLADFFEEGSGAYAFIAQEVKRQLSEAFPGREPDKRALDALCAEEAILAAPFTLGAARMTLTYRADALYPGKESLLHVQLYYPQIMGMMTQYGLRQTDNSRYRMVALTYDDGGARGITRSVLDSLREHGAQATFFVVGERFSNNRDILLRQQDGKHSIQSHTYSHRYPDEMKKGEAQKEKERMIALLGEITGVPPTMMRAPGGHCAYYARQGIGYPLIQWSLASGDSGNPHYDQIARRVIDCASDGAVILMHDINPGSPTYTQQIVKSFAERGILCVTVEELFADAGVPLEENLAYKNPYRMEQ